MDKIAPLPGDRHRPARRRQPGQHLPAPSSAGIVAGDDPRTRGTTTCARSEDVICAADWAELRASWRRCWSRCPRGAERRARLGARRSCASRCSALQFLAAAGTAAYTPSLEYYPLRMKRRLPRHHSGSSSPARARRRAVYAYDAQRTTDTIAEGVRIAGVDVGGMNADAARAKLQRALSRRCAGPSSSRYEATQRSADAAARRRSASNIDALVDQALAGRREGSLFTRAWRERHAAARRRRRVDATDHLLAGAVRRGSSPRCRAALDQPAADASVDFSTTAHDPTSGPTTGCRSAPRRCSAHARARVLDVRATAATCACRRARSSRRSRPPSSPRSTRSSLIVDRGAFTLRSTRTSSRPRPTGSRSARSGWRRRRGSTRSRTRQIEPGLARAELAPGRATWPARSSRPAAENPIKARWMGIFDGAGIHGTDAIGSLGTPPRTAASGWRSRT